MTVAPPSGSKIPLDPEEYAARPTTWRLWRRYRLVWRRRYLLFKAFRARHALTLVQDKTTQIRNDDILCFVTLRNEADRLPHFLKHHRALGVDHFMIVENDSQDGSAEYLKSQPDVSIWQTNASYRGARFGVSWLTWLQRRYGRDHWCLTLDCDELLIYPNHDQIDLQELTSELDRRKMRSFRTVMIELFPKGPIDQKTCSSNDDPVSILPYFDAHNFVRRVHPEFLSLIEKGGVRTRYFFDDVAEHGPPMHKTPLVKWHRSFAYADSTHTILPRFLNQNYGPERITGALLHTKFLPSVVAKSADEAHRAQHFADPKKFEAYYDELVGSPDFWHEGAETYKNWQQLVELGLMSEGAGVSKA
jgi:hypothetical protein